jgi:hypothetical protein
MKRSILIDDIKVLERIKRLIYIMYSFNDSPIMKSISTDLKESNFIITSHENNDSEVQYDTKA